MWFNEKFRQASAAVAAALLFTSLSISFAVLPAASASFGGATPAERMNG